MTVRYDKLLSNFSIIFNLRRYNMGDYIPVPEMNTFLAKCGDPAATAGEQAAAAAREIAVGLIHYLLACHATRATLCVYMYHLMRACHVARHVLHPGFMSYIASYDVASVVVHVALQHGAHRG